MSTEDLDKDTDHEAGDEESTYKPPPEKSLTEIVKADEDDESLRKYKETLLGNAAKDVVIVDANNPKRVIVKTLALLVEGRDDIIIDLTGDLSELKKTVFRVKEGIQYRVRIDFYVQKEIVTGLKYKQKIHKHGLKVEQITLMVGSYGPKHELQSYTSPLEEMPSGMLARGTYVVKSLFTDDDNNEWLKWSWQLEVKKDWE
ncbi:rho GDP-dissociation inhibitor 1-like protein [Dinothrombium tinctorium]|uniref:Rho GDP-dissociation inhibitor 3 n=1 Tax=Dinothrombium tinctorium TaxID=1965070 RepID=A0A3S3PDX0_9ACAR|nr:rho GDP-dissociation inhibitor 1-like protein [Dinothrombium tinctorium]RWS10427.1 rho GDP-dissociation inhibitor 1-like protein [Dinothrombium tinctorium]RWS10434.1 rho GDP-dissociation inhibitor 1-like protein [Dinothrombium tinctorium]